MGIQSDPLNPSIHGHIGLNKMNQNVDPKTFVFEKGKLHYLAEIREC